MDKKKFTDAISTVVREASISDTLQNVTEPPGRKKNLAEQARSEWYGKLSNEDKEYVVSILREGVDQTVFGFLCVLDGVRAIEDDRSGDLILTYQKGDETTLLNDSEDIFLHDLFRDLLPD